MEGSPLLELLDALKAMMRRSGPPSCDGFDVLR